MEGIIKLGTMTPEEPTIAHGALDVAYGVLERRIALADAKDNSLTEREALVNRIKAEIIELVKPLFGDDVVVIERSLLEEINEELETLQSDIKDVRGITNEAIDSAYDLRRQAESIENHCEDVASRVNDFESEIYKIISSIGDVL